MEGMRHGTALARSALAVLAILTVVGCSSAQQTQRPNVTLTPTLAPYVSNAATATAAPIATGAAATDDISAAPLHTSAIAINKPLRGSDAPVGAVVFGTDVTAGGKNVTLTGQRTTFAAGHEICLASDVA